VAVDFVRGDAAALPFAAASFDHVMCMAAFESITDPLGALAEIHRVLRSGACATIHELGREAPAWVGFEIRSMWPVPIPGGILD
jgi:ubiquinone/menaquinone biosynthesis C-methylase UbiE